MSDKLYSVTVFSRDSGHIVFEWVGLAPNKALAESRAWYWGVDGKCVRNINLNLFYFEVEEKL